jgi:hypothetical protein
MKMPKCILSLLVLASAFVSEDTFAFRLLNSQCESASPLDPFNDPGPYARWNLAEDLEGRIRNGKVLFKINRAGSDNIGDFSRLEAAIKEAADTWQNVQMARAQLEYVGRGEKRIEFNRFDNTNTIFWDEEGDDVDPEALAQTNLLCVNGEILDADIGFNGFRGTFNILGIDVSLKIRWTIKDQQGLSGIRTYLANVQATATHEIGHLLGLHHSEVSGATMAVPAPFDSTEQRTLEEDDERGLAFLYPSLGTVQGRTFRILLDRSATVPEGNTSVHLVKQTAQDIFDTVAETTSDANGFYTLNAQECRSCGIFARKIGAEPGTDSQGSSSELFETVSGETYNVDVTMVTFIP